MVCVDEVQAGRPMKKITHHWISVMSTAADTMCHKAE